MSNDNVDSKRVEFCGLFKYISSYDVGAGTQL